MLKTRTRKTKFGSGGRKAGAVGEKKSNYGWVVYSGEDRNDKGDTKAEKKQELER